MFIAAILASIGATSVFSDMSVPQVPTAPEAAPVAVAELQPPAAPPTVAAAGTPTAPESPAPSAQDKVQGELKNLLHEWRNAWASQDIAAYLAFYTDQFQGTADNPEQWRANRKRIIGQAKSIDIRIGDAEIQLENDNLATLTFALDYASDRFQDKGTKVLLVRRTNGKWLIEQEAFISG